MFLSDVTKFHFLYFLVVKKQVLAVKEINLN